MKVAIVILNWNGASMLRKFLPSVLQYSLEAEVIVADNASTDNSLQVMADEFPNVRTILLDQNYGFAEGYNQALRQVEAEYYLLLNSDVDVVEDWLQPMLKFMDGNADVAACQPKMLCQWDKKMLEYAGACGGYIDCLGYPFCKGRVFGTIEEDRGQYDNIETVAWASGAALLVRSNLYWEVGGLDGRFFAHQEEIDLCWRLRSRGYRIVCVPQSKVYHVGGGTLPKESPRKTYLNFRNNMLLLYKNHPQEGFRKLMLMRFFLDAVASLQFLLKGEWGSFCAVWKARRDYSLMKADFKKDREQNLQLAKVPLSAILTPKSILWQYYIKGRRTFSAIIS